MPQNGTVSAPRLLMLGLDGADLDFIRSRADSLPTLRKALDGGELSQPAAPEALSGAVWPTFYSGLHPGHHGMYQHLVWDATRMGLRRIGYDWCDYRPFWKDMEDQGHRAVVMDVPYSFPTGLKCGVEITDWGTHGQTWPLASNQPDVLARLRQFGRSPIGRETPIEKTPKQLADIRNVLKKSAAKKADLVKLLMKELEWDVFLTVFGETHRGGHLYFSDLDEPQTKPVDEVTPMLDIYRAVDRAMAEILADVDNNTSVLIFSVHGMMRNPAQEHVVAPMMDRLNAIFLKEHCGVAAVKQQSSGGFVGYLRRMVPARLQYAVGAVAPDPIRQWVVEREIIGGLDWKSTPGFALRTDIRTELRLNLKGREAQGMLEPGSELHRRYVEFMCEAFLNLTDADTGARLVDDVVDIHTLFPGPRADRLPDYVVTWRPEPAAQNVHTPLLGSLELERPGVRGGDHTDFGFALFVEGENAPVGQLPPLNSITDFAAFVSSFMGTAAATRAA